MLKSLNVCQFWVPHYFSSKVEVSLLSPRTTIEVEAFLHSDDASEDSAINPTPSPKKSPKKCAKFDLEFKLESFKSLIVLR